MAKTERKETPIVHIDYNLVDTTFDKLTDFEGTLAFQHSLKVNGRFKGKISTPGFLYIGETANVEADIEADIVILEGTVKGNILAHSKIEMMATGKLYGDLKTAKLQISDGVIFEGNCTMLKPEKSDKKNAAQKPPAEKQQEAVKI